MTLASRYIDAPQPPIPEWRKEFGSYQILRDFEQLKKAVDVSVHNWPRELSAPLIKKFDGAWQSLDKPPTYRDMAPVREAVEFAESIARELKTLRLEMVSGDTELCELANRCARQCEQYPHAAEWIVRRVGLKLPEGRGMTDTGKLLRMQCVRWWRRSMRAHFGQAVENAMRERGYVRKGKAAYCTDWALRRRTSQRVRTATMLQSAIAINELGEQMSLFDAAQTSVSNPVNRRNELMTRIRGFEEIATECGHIALFGTLTAPGFFHAQHSAGGENEAYARQGRRSVRAAQSWLCRRWAIARSRLHKAGVDVYGFRIAEPHHDGTPHWHLLLFVKKEHAWVVKWILRATWCIEYPDEKGASKYRCNFKKINPALGDAAGYIAKYVAKNIDGFEVGPDYEAGGEAKTTAHRVDAWASTHRIRQFQQIGGAPVGIWRELRKASASADVHNIEMARVCADDGDWKGFNEHAAALSLWKEQSAECNAYREVRQPTVVGIETWPQSFLQELSQAYAPASSEPSSQILVRVRTRLHEWRINWSGNNANAKTALSVVSGYGALGSGQSDAHGYGNLHSASAHGVRHLGPVSITVPTHEDQRIDPRYAHIYTNSYKPTKQFVDHRLGPLPSDHLKPSKQEVPPWKTSRI